MTTEKQQVNKTARLTETAIMIAAAAVLSFIKLVDMPFGGSVTLFSMLPIAVISFRYGIGWGSLAGFVNALLQMLFGLKNLTYATSATAVIAIMLLDYIIAFVVIGLAGMFRNRISDNGTALALGTFAACALRYICHVISGCTVWAGVSIPDADGLVYSLAYNATYMVPETVVTVIGAFFAANIFTLTAPSVKRIKMNEKSALTLYSTLPAAAGIVLAFAMICGMMQGESGFDITLLASAEIWNWISLGAIILIAAIASVIVYMVLSKKVRSADTVNTVGQN